jgi:hypothetical protein
MKYLIVNENPERTSYTEGDTSDNWNVQVCDKCDGTGQVFLRKISKGTREKRLQSCGTCGSNGRVKWKTVYQYERLNLEEIEVPTPDPEPTRFPGDKPFDLQP